MNVSHGENIKNWPFFDRGDPTEFLKSDLSQKVNIDQSGSNTAALERINSLLFIHGLWHLLIEMRRIKYLNKDHRGIKNITNIRLGLNHLKPQQLLQELSCIECLKKYR